MLVAPEHAAVPDVFEAVFVNHDCHDVRVDLECRDERVRELFDDLSFLLGCPAFAHLENNDGHDNSLTGSMGTADIYFLVCRDSATAKRTLFLCADCPLTSPQHSARFSAASQ